jgi:hypothetical protein
MGFSLPPKIARAIEQTAQAEQKTKSELLRDMWEAYQIVREERQFAGLQRAARRQARAAGLEIQSENDVDRILHQG